MTKRKNKKDEDDQIIRSTKTSLRFVNTNKLKQLHEFIDEYRLVVAKFVDIIWDLEKVDCELPKEITSQISTWLCARAVQAAGKQASGIVRGTKRKQKKRIWVYNKLMVEGAFK